RPEPDPRAPLADLLGGDASELAEQFRVIVNRRSFAATDGNAWFDAAIDFGEITVDGRFVAFCEVELELKSGEPAALFRLARRIGTQAPARIGVLSKAERGYRLLGPILAAEKAEKLRLDPCMSVVDGFAAVVHACLKQYRLNETIALERCCPAAVHQARVAVRRLRTALSVFRPLLRCDGMSRELNTRLRDLAREFGKVRDLDILIAHPTSAPVRSRLRTARDPAYEELTAVLAGPEARGLPLAIVEWVQTGSWRSDPVAEAQRRVPLPEFAAAALDRAWRKVRKDGRHLAVLPTAERHQLRKDVKRLRYAAEFFERLFPIGKRQRRHKTFARALGKLQDALGALNDIAVAEHVRQELGLVGDLSALPEPSDPAGQLARAAKARRKLLKTKKFWR
ncbi:MAG: CHAD domain-containing protein, partial [Novosphingobium sp.]|nr:CHAD domain-containing protein [Novosphingobium sp.]